MRRRSILGTAATLLFGRSFPVSAAETPPALVGRWSGVLQAGVRRLRLSLDVATDGTGTLRSLDQGGGPIPAVVASEDGDRIRIEVAPIGGVFEGRLSDDRLEGTWRQGGAGLPLVLARGDRAPSPPPVAPLDDAGLRDLLRASGAPALAAAVARRNGATQVWAQGERQAGSGATIGREDRWHLGSITKSLTATLVARLVDGGRVRWDDTVGEHLAEAAPDMRAEHRGATFRHLLSHRSGLPGNLPMADLLRYERRKDDPRADRVRYVRQTLGQAPVGPAERTFEYSNSGYVVAAAMLEAKLGESWERLIGDWVFTPLRLGSAGFGAPGRADAVAQPVGHGPGPQGPATPYPPGAPVNDNPAVLGPAGRVHMSLPDLLLYLSAHRDRTDFLQTATWSVLHTPPFGGDYALGWFVRPGGELWHAGSNTLWYAEALVGPATGVAAAAAANSAAAASVVGSALARAAAGSG